MNIEYILYTPIEAHLLGSLPALSGDTLKTPIFIEKIKLKNRYSNLVEN